jgi:protein-S-isoprenylcysteine O-methyltransferase Ste14
MMDGTGFWWILLAVCLYGVLHSILAANRTKGWVAANIGQDTYRRYYRLFFSIMGGLTFLPVLALAALLPDRTLYAIPVPWVYLTLGIQGLAVIGLIAGVMQTGTLRFVGIHQVLAYDPRRTTPRPEKLVLNGLYRWVRHPLYTCTYLFLWLTPTMTWNLLALNLGITVYMWVGTIFEERKLVEQFGRDYEQYRARTPRIIPGLKL